jgi:hypothetical protein
MNTIEEQLWNYIDGNCSPAEKVEIEQKIASDASIELAYTELLAFNASLNSLTLAEPSMSFTRNVTEQVKLEIAPVTLKTKVNNAIIYAITGFFGIAIFAVLAYIVSQSKTNFTLPNLNFKLNFTNMVSPTALRIFLMVDLVLALIYLDSFLRKSKKLRTKKGG